MQRRGREGGNIISVNLENCIECSKTSSWRFGAMSWRVLTEARPPTDQYFAGKVKVYLTGVRFCQTQKYSTRVLIFAE
jgi:hypothetical protein